MKGKANNDGSISIGKKINIPDTSIYDFICNRSSINAMKTAVICGERQLLFKDIPGIVNDMAGRFAALDIQQGDVVAFLTKPCIDALIAFLSINKIGAIATFIECNAGPKKIAEYMKRFSCRLLMADENVILQDYEGIGNDCRMITFAELSAFQPSNSCCEVSDSTVDTPALITYTSGTTGNPKAILLSNGNIIFELISENKSTHLQFGPRGPVLQTVPFNYPYGFIISTLLPLYAGKTVVLSPDLTTNNLKDYLTTYRPAYIFGIPHIYVHMLHSAEFRTVDLSFLKYAISGGDKISSYDKHLLNDFFHKHGSKAFISDGSGNGEGCGALTNTASLFGKVNYDSVGKPNFGVSVKFVDNNDIVVPIGEEGRFCFAGQNLMLEYYRDPDATSEVCRTDSDGVRWFYTDTFGHMDRTGWIYFDGRARRFFITFDEQGSPYKVYCDYVQELIQETDGIISCAVVGRSDPNRGLAPVAYIVVENQTDFESIKNRAADRCMQLLPSSARPIKYYALNKLPVTNAGKIDYRALEERDEED